MAVKKKLDNSLKKILIVNYEYPPLGGGGGVATRDLAGEWAKSAQVDVLTLSFGDLPAYEVVDNVSIYRARILFRKSRDVATFFSMFCYIVTGFFVGLRLMRRNNYDIINTHFALPSGPLGLVLSKLFGVRNVLSLHGGDIYDPSKKLSPHRSIIFRTLVNMVLRNADSIVAQSTNTRDNALKFYRPRREIGIIPLPFLAPEPLKTTRKALGIKKDSFVFVFIGRLIKRKDIATALRALALLPSRNWIYCIIGEGPERSMIESLSAQLGIEKNLRLLGFVDEKTKYEYLSLSDCMLVTSLHEGFGIIFMEAMYFAKPIVCTNNGGQVDFLKQKKNALLCDVGDSEGCARHLHTIMTDAKLRESLCQRNSREISRFFAPAVAEQYMRLFEQIRRKRENDSHTDRR